MRPDFYADYFELEGRHWWFAGRRRVFGTILDRYLPPAPDGHERRLLDVGCGTGTMIAELARYGRAQGIDADPRAVALSRRRGVSDVEQVVGPPWPFPAGTFDLISMLDVLEHVEDDLGLLREANRTLRPDGLLLASVPAYRLLWGVQDEISHHVRRYTASELRERSTAAGFAVVRLTYFNTLLFAPIAGIRLLRRVVPWIPRPRSDFQMTRSGRVNDLLARIFSSEARLLARSNLPFGVSVLLLARKPA